MSFASTNRSFSSTGVIPSRPNSFEHSVTSAHAAPPLLALILKQCDGCSHQIIAYNSCRNRHCPKCQSTARDKWLAARSAELLPVPYCHVVFTLPQELSALALQNPRSDLQHAVPRRFRDPADHRGRSAPTRRANRISRRTAHLESEDAAPSASALRGSLRRTVAGSLPVDSMPAAVFLPVKVLGKKFRGKFLAFLAAAFRKKKLRFLAAWHTCEPQCLRPPSPPTSK